MGRYYPSRRTIRPHEQWEPTPNMQAAVYMATNQLNGHSYVGFTAQPLRLRIGGHIGASVSRGDTKFCRAISRYGRDNFDFIVLSVCVDREEARIAERQLILILRPEYNDPPTAAKKQVICLNDGKVYQSGAEAAKAYGLNRYCVAAVANPKQRLKSISGYKFEYVGAV